MLRNELETTLRDVVGPLEEKVNRLEQENVVLRWSCGNLISAIQDN